MKQAFYGILIFIGIGIAGYLTKDYFPSYLPHWSKAQSKLEDPAILSGVQVGGPDAAVSSLREKLIKELEISGVSKSTIATLFASSSLGSALGDNKLNSAIASAEERCRARLRQLGVIITSGQCIDIGEIVNNLAQGSYYFNKPDSARVGNRFRLRLLLQTAEGQKLNAAKSFGDLPGQVQTRQGTFAQLVEATLSGDDFKISPEGAVPRVATLSHPVEWEWTIEPIKPGTKSLTIEVAANLQIGADKQRVQIATLHETILIEISAYEQVKMYFADVSGGIIAGAALVAPLAVLFGVLPKLRTFIGGLFVGRRPRQRPTRKTK